MIYNGTDKAEIIYFHNENDKRDLHFITMERDSDNHVFYVRACCNSEWEWKFHYTLANYEMVKHAIFDIGFDSENMADMLWNLDSIFEDIFDEIVVWEEHECNGNCECDNGCEHCGCKE
jgi:hypothetical protein